MPDTDSISPDEAGTLVSRETAVARGVDAAVMPYRGESYEEMQSDRATDVKYGVELEEGNRLIGVPFIALRLTYRPGGFISPVTNEAGHYVSIDLMVGPEREIAKGIRRGRITEPCDVEPGELLVINEGGTGVYRQTVEFLETKGWIILPDGPKNGAYSESRYDTPLDKWRYPDASPVEVRFDINGDPIATADIRLECPRGLRASEYDNPSAKPGTNAKAITRYIA